MIGLADILAAPILIVDDKQDNVRLLEGMLRVAGYTSVHSTSDPAAVCALYRQNRYSLILLDLQMPDLDGFQVLEGLKEIEGEGYLPVLVITAQPAHKLRALEAGAKDFLSKPFEMAEFRARVHNILEVRLLHLEARTHSRILEQTVRELEASRELVRLKELAEKEQRERELQLAQETQASLLPHVLPQFANYRIHAFNIPTHYVGGDFYDFVSTGTGEWVGVLGDVSGKGMAAALLSSMVIGALSAELRAGTPPAETLNRVSRLINEKSLPFQFVTLFLLVMKADGRGHFISAGHNPARLYRAATGNIERLFSENYALGMFDFALYETRDIHLGDGDILVVYSDGVTEAENEREEMFGEERLVESIRETGPAGGQALEERLLKDLADFTSGAPQRDDITFILVEKQVISTAFMSGEERSPLPS